MAHFSAACHYNKATISEVDAIILLRPDPYAPDFIIGVALEQQDPHGMWRSLVFFSRTESDSDFEKLYSTYAKF